MHDQRGSQGWSLLRIRVSSVALAAAGGWYILAGAVFLLLVGADALAGNHQFQFFADSSTYLRTFADRSVLGGEPLVGVAANYLGPMLLLRLVGGDIYLVLCVNVVMFVLSVASIARQLGLSSLKIAGLLALSPLTLSSLLSVNKEILTFPFLALALSAYRRKSIVLAALALAVAFLSRWQFALFGVVLLFASGSFVLVRSRLLRVGGLLAASSVAYLAMKDFFSPVIAVVERALELETHKGSGSFAMLLAVQDLGLYLLIFPLKAAHLLFAMGLRFDRLFNPGNVYNDFFIVMHCFATLVVCVLVVRARRFTLRHDFVFSSIIFLAVFCLSPIYSPRYLYPVFVAWVLVLAGAPADVRRGLLPRPVRQASDGASSQMVT